MIRNDLPSLPADADALRVLLHATMAERHGLRVERDTLVTERDALLAQIERQQHWLLQPKRMQFGPRSERLPEDERQLAFEDLEQAIARGEAEAEKRDPELREARTTRRRASRGALHANLPRVEITLAPENAACPCCQLPMTMIGEDTSERLDVIPAQYRVIVTRRPKFVCQACAGVVVQEEAPARLIEGGIPTEATVAHVAVGRYVDHQPLYRQAQMTARQGVPVGSLYLGFLGGLRGSGSGACRVAAARDVAELGPVVRRRNRRAGARSGAWAYQAGVLLDHCAR